MEVGEKVAGTFGSFIKENVEFSDKILQIVREIASFENNEDSECKDEPCHGGMKGALIVTHKNLNESINHLRHISKEFQEVDSTDTNKEEPLGEPSKISQYDLIYKIYHLTGEVKKLSASIHHSIMEVEAVDEEQPVIETPSALHNLSVVTHAIMNEAICLLEDLKAQMSPKE